MYLVGLGNILLGNIDNTTHGIRSILQCRRTFYDFYAIYVEGVYFEAVIIAPLLPFLLNAILIDQDAVPVKPSDDRFGDSGTHINSGDSGKYIERLRKGAISALFKKISIQMVGGQRYFLFCML